MWPRKLAPPPVRTLQILNPRLVDLVYFIWDMREFLDDALDNSCPGICKERKTRSDISCQSPVLSQRTGNLSQGPQSPYTLLSFIVGFKLWFRKHFVPGRFCCRA